MKNFKKVISAVIALAMSVSSLVAVNASSFSDVADTASYAEAVDVLSALGVVTGYEDGSFKPDGEITRAEAATMIVGALNMAADAKASAGSSQFDDVNTQASWAAGYVNIGVAQNFIAGMSQTEFAPQENVTFAQMCKMLDCITGYGDYAASNGGWPTGYTSLASQTGITKGVSASTDTKLTRGQVAQMIYNALVTPMLGVTEYNLTGNTYQQLDGKKDRDFKTVLSDKFDAYVVTANITSTSKEDSGLNTSKGEQVQYKITSADWYKDGTYDRSVETATAIPGLKAYVGDTEVANYKTSTGKAIVQYDDNDDSSKFVYFAINAKTETKELEASLADSFVAASGSTTYDTVKFQKSTSTSSTNDYKIENSSVDALIVNGVSMDLNADTFEKFVKNATGTVVLSKDSSATNWQYITVDYYELAKISSVTYNGSTTTISFDEVYAIPTMTLVGSTVSNKAALKKISISDDEIEDGDKTLNVYLKGEAIKATEMQEDDIVSIAFDPTEDGDASKSSFFDIYVSRDTAEGKLTTKDKDDKTFTVAGTEYDVYNYANLSSMETGSEYTFYIDAFGRICDKEEIATSKKFAILQKYLSSDEKITLILADGTVKSYEYELGASDVTSEHITFSSATSPAAKVCSIINGTDGTSTATTSINGIAPVQYRVVEYKLKNSTGKITELNQVDGTLSASYANDEYNASIKRVGNIKFGTATNIIDASDYVENATASKASLSDYAAITTDGLSDNEKYTAFGWKSSTSSEYANFVVVTVAGSTYNSSTRFAVVKKIATDSIENEDGDEVYEITLLYKGEEVVYQSENNLSSTKSLKPGNVVVFTVNADGYMTTDKTTVVFNALGDADTTAYDGATTADVTLAAAAMTDAVNQSGILTLPGNTNDWASATGFKKTSEDVQLVFGIITKRSSDNVEFGIAGTDGVLDLAKNLENDTSCFGVTSYGFASDAAVYSYDRGEKVKYGLEVGTKGSIIASSITSLNKKDADVDKVFFKAGTPDTGKENCYLGANYGVALVVNGAIEDIFVINQK